MKLRGLENERAFFALFLFKALPGPSSSESFSMAFCSVGAIAGYSELFITSLSMPYGAFEGFFNYPPLKEGLLLL